MMPIDNFRQAINQENIVQLYCWGRLILLFKDDISAVGNSL